MGLGESHFLQTSVSLFVCLNRDAVYINHDAVFINYDVIYKNHDVVLRMSACPKQKS